MQLKITKTAEKSIKKLNEPFKSRIIEAVKKLPSGDVKKLRGYDSFYRLRVGDYRVIYKMENEIITVADVLPRGEAYKRI